MLVLFGEAVDVVVEETPRKFLECQDLIRGY